jgi:hypothetical protein
MLATHNDPPAPPPMPLPALAATDLQDHLLMANNDLERLQRLLDDASQALMRHFTYASEHMDAALVHLEATQQGEPPTIREARMTLATAITALQFQDMATQLIAHTSHRCATAPTAWRVTPWATTRTKSAWSKTPRCAPTR